MANVAEVNSISNYARQGLQNNTKKRTETGDRWRKGARGAHEVLQEGRRITTKGEYIHQTEKNRIRRGHYPVSRVYAPSP